MVYLVQEYLDKLTDFLFVSFSTLRLTGYLYSNLLGICWRSRVICILSRISIRLISIYKFGLSVCLSVCLFVCLYPINVKTAEPIGPKFFVGHHVTPGKVYGWSNFQNMPPSKFDFWKFWKSTNFFENLRNVLFLLFVNKENPCVF